LDESKVAMSAGVHSYAGAVAELQRFEGAVVTRVMHPPDQRIEAHRHDWPVLAVHCIGAYAERTDDGETAAFDGPGVVFHPAGALHEDEIGAPGLETLSMSFDPAWLDSEARAALPTRSVLRSGGAAALAARALVRQWLAGDEAACRAGVSRFFAAALPREAHAQPKPDWFDALSASLETAPTQALAHTHALHPAWMARAYRAWRGEGLGETLRRKRVERAVLMLRADAEPLAQIAVDAGFCDQSHMNRCFRAVLARTPAQVRDETALVRAVA
jgi:AraC family transcriptional regulator